MMRAIGITLIVGWLSVGLRADGPLNQTGTDETTANQPMSFWMQKKMDYSSEILRGLATQDFETVKDRAKKLRLLNRVEGFVRRRNPEYRENLNTFERLTNELFRHADEQNTDGVLLAFNQLTVSCVRCHQSLRNDEVSNTSESKSK